MPFRSWWNRVRPQSRPPRKATRRRGAGRPRAAPKVEALEDRFLLSVGLIIEDTQVIEGNGPGMTMAVFPVLVTSSMHGGMQVPYSTETDPGTATPGVDYVPEMGTLFIPAGATMAFIDISVIGDTVPEQPNEWFSVRIFPPTFGGGHIRRGVARATIVDDDSPPPPPPTISINDVSVVEGNSGTTNATFTVTLSRASGQEVRVNYATANGTATAPADYHARTGTVIFAPGQTMQRIDVPVVGDLMDEPDETFFVNLSNPSPATVTIADSQGRATIVDDDEPAPLVVNGTAGNDYMLLSDGDAGPAYFKVEVNGVLRHTGLWSSVSAITLNGLAGDDLIDFKRGPAGVALQANGGDGDDRIQVSSGNNQLATIQSTLILNGNAGSDTVHLFDHATSANQVYTFTTNQLTYTGRVQPINFGTVESVSLLAGSGNDTIRVLGTAAGTTLTINARGGNDTVGVIGTDGSLDSIQGAVIVDGEGGNDVLSLQDGGSAGRNYAITATGISRPGAALISHSTVEDVALIAGSGNDTFNVQATPPAGTIVRITSLGGNDTINGTPGNDYILVSDLAADASFFDVRVNDRVRFSGRWSSVPGFSVNGQAGDDLIDFKRGPAGVTLTANGGDGDDRIQVSSGNNQLATIQSNLILNGNAGSDTVHLFDHATSAAQTYGFTASQFTRTGGPPIDLSTVESVSLFAGTGNDTVNVQSTAAGTTVTINARGGNDTINAGGPSLEGIQGPVIVDGEGGNDLLNLNDLGSTAGYSYALTAMAVNRSGTALISHSTVENVVLNTSTGNDTINVQGTTAGTTVLVNSGAGADTITVGGPGNSLASIQGAVQVYGQGGTDTLTVNDHGTSAGQSYAVTGDTITRSGAAAISYGFIENLDLNTATGSDTINVNHGCLPPPPGLVSWWAGDGNANDIASGNHGTLLNGATLAPGRVGPAFRFDGVDDFVRIGDVLDPGLGSVTVQAWIQLTAVPFEASIIRKGLTDISSPPNVGFALVAHGAIPSFSVGDGPNHASVSAPSAISLNMFHHVAGVLDRASSMVRLYLDGVLVGQQSFTALGNIDTAVNLALGAGDRFPAGPTDTQFFPGLIDEVQYFNRALSASEIQAIFNAGGAGQCKNPGLNLRVNAGGGNDTVNVQSTATGTTVTVNAGDGNDTIRVGSGGSLAALQGSLRVDGQGGSDTLDYTGIASGVSVNLLTGAATGVSNGLVNVENVTGGSGNDLLVGNAAANVLFGGLGNDELYGGDGNDMLNGGDGDDFVVIATTAAGGSVTVNGGSGFDAIPGPDVDSTWSITSLDAGSLNGTVAFTGVEIPVGGLATDTYVFADGAGISGYIYDLGGNDTLDYSAYTSGVYVWLLYNLATGAAFGVYGIENVAGGSGDDILRGDGADNILFGGPGNDLLLGYDGYDWLDGGPGRDILVGGYGYHDWLFGSDGDDVLIDGSTAYDDDDGSLLYLLAEWARTDLGYDERVAALRPNLDPTTVYPDATPDELYGQGGLDWFWADLPDVLDWEPGEYVN